MQRVGCAHRCRSLTRLIIHPLTFKLIARDIPPVLPGEGWRAGIAVNISGQGLLAEAAERPWTTEVATSFFERHHRVRPLTSGRRLQPTWFRQAGMQHRFGSGMDAVAQALSSSEVTCRCWWIG